MNFIKKTLILALISLSALVLNSRAYSAGTYGLSCTNSAYGTQVSSLYLNIENTALMGDFSNYGVYYHRLTSVWLPLYWFYLWLSKYYSFHH